MICKYKDNLGFIINTNLKVGAEMKKIVLLLRLKTMMRKQIRIFTIIAVAALISFASGAAAAPNTFDADGDLCLIGGNTAQEIGTPMELWAEVDDCCDDKFLAGLVTFDSGNVIINLTDVDEDGIPDMYPFVATSVHIHFADDLSGIPHFGTGDPRLGRFEYRIDDLKLFEYKVESVNPFQSEIVIPVDFDAVGAIHLTVEKDYSGVDIFDDYLTDDPVQMQIIWPDLYSYVELTLSGSDPDGDGPLIGLDGVYEGWCVDVDQSIVPGAVYDAHLYSSYEDLSGLDFENPENFDKVNYLLNNFYAGMEVMPLMSDCTPKISCGSVISPEELTKGDIQRAIWILIDDDLTELGLGPWSQHRVNAILCDVNANGENFIPSCAEETVFIVVPDDGNTQLITGQTQISTLGVPCETVCLSDAWGDGLSGEEFDGILWGTYFNYDAECVPVE